MSTTDQPTGTPQPEPEPVEEQWAYGGVRELSGKRVHAWLPEAGTGRELLYTTTGSFVIGEIYRASVTRSPEGKTCLARQPALRRRRAPRHGGGAGASRRAPHRHHPALAGEDAAQRRPP